MKMFKNLLIIGVTLVSMWAWAEFSPGDAMQILKRPKWDLPEAEEAVKTLLASNDPKVQKAVTVLVKKQWTQAEKIYRKDYAKALVRYLRSHQPKPLAPEPGGRKMTLKAEISASQKAVSDCFDPLPTHEKIVDQADPALARLKEVLICSPATLLAADTVLVTAHGKGLLLAKMLDLCTEKERYAGLTKEQVFYEMVPPCEADNWERMEWVESLRASSVGKRNMKVLEKNEKLAAQINAAEARGILDMNITRMVCGLNALEIDPRLCLSARDHARDMNKEGFFAHESPVPKKKSPADRAARFGTTCFGENIAMGQESELIANEGWWHSPGHFVNMMLPRWTVIGYGKYERHWVQNFR